jgi:hypothetical protein
MYKNSLVLIISLYLGIIARADEAAIATIKKAVEAHGGEKALLAAKAGTMKIKATMIVMGLEMEVSGDVAFSFPGKYATKVLAETQGQKVEITQIVSGDTIKMIVNGTSVPVEQRLKDEMKQQMVNQEINMIVPMLDAKKFTLKAEKDATIDSVDTAVVLVSAKGIKDLKMFFDKKTGLLVRTQRTGLDPTGAKEVDEVSHYSNYQKVDGVQTAMSSKVSHDGKLYLSAKMSDVKYVDKLDNKYFAVDD